MVLISSISGIRGTIGGKPGEGLTPVDLVRFASAYGAWLRNRSRKPRILVVIGRDARISGPMVRNLVTGSLTGLGIDVVDLGLASTPTVEMAVTEEQADGGIILSASHNPQEWNAMKLLNGKGEFISAAEGEEILTMAHCPEMEYAGAENLGTVRMEDRYNQFHIDRIAGLNLVDTRAIAGAGFRVVIDCVNSVGGVVIPDLLKRLGVDDVVMLNCEPSGRFTHNPEPLPENMEDLAKAVVHNRADIGFAVDPDVDRLAVVCEDGTMFGEEYTLVAVADYVLSRTPGNTVSNLSSTRALKDITLRRGGTYAASAVGEVNVVEAMKQNNAVIGGEGNGGVIYPALHYGRDALVGIALFLTHLAREKKRCSELRSGYPSYHIAKKKITLPPGIQAESILGYLQERFAHLPSDTTDGLWLDFSPGWVHIRRSNTEPILRIYAESASAEQAEMLAGKIIAEIPGYQDFSHGRE